MSLLTTALLRHLRDARHSPIHNYVVPGLTSWLIGERSLQGCVRLFTCERDQVEHVTPHSHRYDFHAVVLEGSVRNVLWRRAPASDGDFYIESDLVYGNAVGAYERREGAVARFATSETRFEAGEHYAMRSHEIHSIYFARNTSVLVFEGATKKTVTTILEPAVLDQHGSRVPVPTFKVEPWMFQRPRDVASTGGAS